MAGTTASRYHGKRVAKGRTRPPARSRQREMTALQRRRTLQLVVAGGIFVHKRPPAPSQKNSCGRLGRDGQAQEALLAQLDDVFTGS